MVETRSGKRRRELREREEAQRILWQEFVEYFRRLTPAIRRSIWTFSGICVGCYENTTPIHNEDYFPSYQETIDIWSLHNRRYPHYCKLCEVVYCKDCSAAYMLYDLDGIRRCCTVCVIRRIRAEN